MTVYGRVGRSSIPYTDEMRSRFLQIMMLQSLIHELEDRDIETPLEKALKVGQKFTYEYDFGSTTYLALKVMSEREEIVRRQHDLTPKAQECITRLCSYMPFEGATEVFKELTGAQVSQSTACRLSYDIIEFPKL